MEGSSYNLYMYIYSEYKKFSNHFSDVNDFVYKNRFTTIIRFYNDNIKGKYNNEKNINYDYYKKFNINTIEILQTKCQESYEPPFRLILCKSEYNEYGIHRYGWKFVIKNFLETCHTENCFTDKFYFHNPGFEWVSYALENDLYDYDTSVKHFMANKTTNKDKKSKNMKNIIFDDWLEKSYNWNIKNDYNNQFISFIHDPPGIQLETDIFNIFKGKLNNSVLNGERFLKEKNKLKILITLSDYHNRYLQINQLVNETTIIKTLYHPLEITNPKYRFNIQEFIFSPEKTTYTAGWWLRKYNNFMKLTGPKVIIVKSNESKLVSKYIFNSLRKELVSNSDVKDTREIKENDELTQNELSILKNKYNIDIQYNLDNDEYDKIFNNNILFLDLHDAIANNFILEAIMNNTPILVNYVTSVVEYLGKDYPFYYTNYMDAQYKMDNLELVLKTHLYLKNMDKTRFTYNYFNKELKKIIIDNV